MDIGCQKSPGECFMKTFSCSVPLGNALLMFICRNGHLFDRIIHKTTWIIAGFIIGLIVS